MKIDPIAEPWGSRTPYRRGDPWARRIDTYLEPGLHPNDVDRWVQSAAVLHSNGDGLASPSRTVASSVYGGGAWTASITADWTPRIYSAGRSTPQPTG